MKRRRLRSVWGPQPIISIVATRQADALLGIESDTLVFSTYRITSAFTRDYSAWCRGRIGKVVVPFLLFPWILARYDVFHFFADRGILPSFDGRAINAVELWLLRRLGKKIFVYTYGGDVRTRRTTLALGRYNCCVDCPAIGRACVCDERRQSRNLDRIRRYATAVLSMGDMTEYTPGTINDVFYWPLDVDGIPYVGVPPAKSGPVSIVHAANHRAFKGTAYLQAAVERLGREGLAVELTIVENLPNDQAMRLYSSADIVAEQFLIGSHGYQALEAMALGKPVVAFIRKPEYVCAPDECPIVSADPDQLLGVLRALIRDPARRVRLGELGRRYVETHYSTAAFAGRLRRLYEEHGVPFEAASQDGRSD